MVWKQSLANRSTFSLFTSPFYPAISCLCVSLFACTCYPMQAFQRAFFRSFWIYISRPYTLFACFTSRLWQASPIQDRIYRNQWQFGPRTQLFHLPLLPGIKNTHKEAGFLFFSPAHFKSLQVILDKRKILLASKGQGKKKRAGKSFGEEIEKLFMKNNKCTSSCHILKHIQLNGVVKNTAKCQMSSLIKLWTSFKNEKESIIYHCLEIHLCINQGFCNLCWVLKMYII